MRDDRDNVARVQRADSENGISANAIHMMDATHMMMTIVQLKYDGVEDMMMIHDSFSVMPADMDVLWSAVRKPSSPSTAIMTCTRMSGGRSSRLSKSD